MCLLRLNQLHQPNQILYLHSSERKRIQCDDLLWRCACCFVDDVLVVDYDYDDDVDVDVGSDFDYVNIDV